MHYGKGDQVTVSKMDAIVLYVHELRVYTDAMPVGSLKRQVIDAGIDAFAAGIERTIHFIDVPEINTISLRRFMAEAIEANVKVLSSGMNDADRRPIVGEIRRILKDWLAH